MYCEKCGKLIPSNIKHCIYCDSLQTQGKSRTEIPKIKEDIFLIAPVAKTENSDGRSSYSKEFVEKPINKSGLKEKKSTNRIPILIFILIIITLILAYDMFSHRIGIFKTSQSAFYDEDQADWERASEAYSAENWMPLEEYITKHTNGKHVREAEELLDYLAWEKAESTHAFLDYDYYIRYFPEGNHFDEAMEEFRWLNAFETKELSAYSLYLEDYPLGKYSVRAIEEIDWLEARMHNSLNHYYRFIEKYPEDTSAYNSLAKDNIWAKVKEYNLINYYKEFIRKCPDDKRAEMAEIYIEKIIWDEVVIGN